MTRLTHAALPAALLPVALLLAACEEPMDDDSAADDDTQPAEGSLVLTDAGNYSYTNAIEIESVDVRTGEDVTFDFSAFTVDIQGHPVDPATEIDSAYVLYFPKLDHEQVEDAIAQDSLLQSDVGLPALWQNPGGATSFLLSDCTVGLSNPLDPAEVFIHEEGTWMVRLTTDLVESRMVMYFAPNGSSTNHTVPVGNDSAVIDFDADLHSLTAVHFTAEPDSYVVDWSQVTRDGLGTDFDPNQIDQAMVARYDLDVSELEAQFFDLELIAAELYYADVNQSTSVDLLTATSADGSASFTGFGSGSLWLLALRCTGCVNPAPPYITVIELGG